MTASYTEEALARVGARTLTGRVGEAHEIAAVALFLVSDASAYVWGEIINVNGGAVFGLYRRAGHRARPVRPARYGASLTRRNGRGKVPLSISFENSLRPPGSLPFGWTSG